MPVMRTLLIGLRASGKTTLGRRLARRTGIRFVDLDERALSRFTEPTVTDVWERHGEPAWREAEVVALREVLDDAAGDDLLVALGGGTPMVPEARRLIDDGRAAGRVRVVYLSSSVDELSRRLEMNTGDRPPLTGGDAVSEIAEIMQQRDPTYRAIADIVMTSDDAPLDEQVERLRDRLFVDGVDGADSTPERDAD